MHVVIIGAGEVGSSIAANLSDAHDVIVIDIDEELVSSVTATYDVLAIAGDGTDLDVLEEANVGEADIVIACTDKDETNLVTCATAKILGDAFTIARVRSTTYYESWQRSMGVFGVDFMVCTDLLSAETIVRIAGLPAARDVDVFADGRVHMAEFDVLSDSTIANKTVKEADQFEDLTFAAIIQDEEITIPRGDTVITAGQKIVVIGSPESVQTFSESLTGEEGRSREVVLIGGSDIAAETARRFEARNVESRLIANDQARCQELAELLPETIVMCHDPTDVDFLTREHVDKSDLVVVMLGSDERNLLVSLLAKQIGTPRTVAVVESGEYVKLFQAVGVDVAINPREVTAEEITRFTHERRTENVALIESDQAEVVEVEIDETSILAGRTVAEATSEFTNRVVIGAITRGNKLIAPRGDTVVEVGDHVVALVDIEVLEDFLSSI